MKLKSSFLLELGNKTELFNKLLLEEDYDFKNKDINVEIKMVNNSSLKVSFLANSVLDLKIGTNAIIKSLEVIDKTLNI